MVAEGDLMDQPTSSSSSFSSSSSSSSNNLLNMIVERIIEDIWYVGKIIDYNPKTEEYTIQYLDDNLIENNIPKDEIRISTKKNIEIHQNKKQTLSKPLIGLVEDDAEIRSSHQPVAIVHSDSDIADRAIFINGSEKKLAAGGGIRALRYLKK